LPAPGCPIASWWLADDATSTATCAGRRSPAVEATPAPRAVRERSIVVHRLQPAMNRKTISILTPCYNEELGIAECHRQIRELFATRLADYDYEHVFIDNCSIDGTVAVLKAIAATDRRVKIIVNSRNFGASRSSFHGLLETRGHAVIPVLADLQTPPDVIPELVAKWEAGCPMVVAVRTGSDEGWFLRQCRKMFYRLMTRFSGIQQIPHFIGFGLYDASVVQVMRDLREPDPYFRGMVCEIGFEKTFVEYHQPPRRHGKSSYTFVSLLDYAVLGLTSYSKVPLRIMTIVGVTLSALSMLVALSYLTVKLVRWDTFELGLAPLLIGTFFFASVQLLFVGLIGEYIGAIYAQVKDRPLVIERERVNFDASDARG
jgi:glycosyltransferase involved in cell wall biosynthesis